MSVATQITRIQTDRNTIRAKMVELGLATNVDNLDSLAEAMDDIINQGSVSAVVKEGETYTIPKGFHNGSGTVSGVAGGGNYSLQSKAAITPTKQQQQVTPDDGYYGLSDVTIGAIPDSYQDVTSVDAVAGDVLTGKTIVDSRGAVVAGTMLNNGTIKKKLTVSDVTYTIPKGFHTGSGTISITPEEKSATPTKSVQSIMPTNGSVLSKVTITAIPVEYQDVSSVDAGAGDVLAGKKIVGADGEVITGTMANNGDVSATIDGLTSTSVNIAAGYTTGGTVSLTSDIEDALAAI